MTVMDNVERIRQAKGIKKQHITKRLGKSASMYSHFLSGRVQPSPGDLDKMAAAMGVEPRVILSDTRTLAVLMQIRQDGGDPDERRTGGVLASQMPAPSGVQ